MLCGPGLQQPSHEDVYLKICVSASTSKECATCGRRTDVSDAAAHQPILNSFLIVQALPEIDIKNQDDAVYYGILATKRGL